MIKRWCLRFRVRHETALCRKFAGLFVCRRNAEIRKWQMKCLFRQKSRRIRGLMMIWLCNFSSFLFGLFVLSVYISTWLWRCAYSISSQSKTNRMKPSAYWHSVRITAWYELIGCVVIFSLIKMLSLLVDPAGNYQMNFTLDRVEMTNEILCHFEEKAEKILVTTHKRTH